MLSLLQPFIFLLSLLPVLTSGIPSPRHFSVHKPAYFLLAGDSTTATQSVGGGGWGDGFLNFTLKQGSSGRNYGHNGATTKSFREGGDWDRLMTEAKTKTANYTVYVTIQFGHNDQKPTSGVDLAQYSDNLIGFAREVASIGAIPVCLFFSYTTFFLARVYLTADCLDLCYFTHSAQIYRYYSTNHKTGLSCPTQSHYCRGTYDTF